MLAQYLIKEIKKQLVIGSVIAANEPLFFVPLEFAGIQTSGAVEHECSIQNKVKSF